MVRVKSMGVIDGCVIENSRMKFSSFTYMLQQFYYFILNVDVLVQSTNCNSKLDDIWKLCITFPFLLYIECLTAWKYYKLSHLLLVGCFCTLYTYISWKCFSQINHYKRSLYRLIIAYDIFAEIDYFNHTKRYLSYQFTLPVLFIHYIDDKHDSEKFFRR